ncbi:SSD domain-containing protein, partial [Trichostrongylus colubriformis]
MGIASAMGGLVLLNVQYNDIVAVMPFLVVAVGTDNMFLMVAAVKRTSRVLPVEQRIGECMADAAVSILITALTDAFSFGVGTITTIPAVQIFCIYTCCALVLTFLYQITFFCALLSLATKWEAEGRHCLWLKTTIPPKVDDSYAKPHYLSLEQHFWHYGATLQIVVSRAPDLRNREERSRINAMVSSFANANHAIGDQSVQFWMREMERYYRTEHNTTIKDEAFYEMASHYLYTHETEPWMEDVKWSLDEHERPHISAFRHISRRTTLLIFLLYRILLAALIFRFLIGMRDISSTTQQQKATKSFREIAAIFPQYNVTTFMPLWLFTDQYDLVVPNTVQDIVIAVLCMLFIAFLLIPQPFCALWVAFTIGSIDLGVLGYMTLWGVNLDAISMITIIMSVGFSVDYSAHITYGYVISKEPDSRDRVRDALGDLGWPVVQGAASTILAVAVLADVPAYMIVTFFKTVFLAISIGLIHGLVFLPLMLSLFVRGFCTIGSRKLDDEPQSIAISTRAPSMSDCSTLQKRYPPPEIPPPRPSMFPLHSFQQEASSPAEFQPASHL